MTDCWWRNWSMAPCQAFPALCARTGAWLGRPQPATRRSDLFRNAEEETAPRTILRREHADAGSVPELVDGVEQVDDVETNRHRQRIVRQQEFALDADIDLGIRRHRADIGVTVAQAAAIDDVGAQRGPAPR